MERDNRLVIFNYWELIVIFIKRDILSRYKGSFLGILWEFLNPIFLLLLYTFVFSIILRIRFPGTTGISGYSLHLFCGLIPWLAFSETIGRAPELLVTNINLVKKTIFPLEILPIMATSTGFIHALFALLILLIAVVLTNGQFLHITVLLLPVVMIPQLLFTLGLSWIISSIGVAIRDLSEIVRIFLTAWMFLTPIMYPIESIPEKYRNYVFINPFAVIVGSYRDLIIKGIIPDWRGLLWISFLGVSMTVLGYIWFIRCKKIFADVI